MAAYAGEPIALETLLRAPSHRLIEQAHAPAETVSATVNADGIGIGWYADDARPATYRWPLPAWADPNLDGLCRSLTRGVWIANGGGAIDPLSNGTANTQPFTDSHPFAGLRRAGDALSAPQPRRRGVSGQTAGITQASP